MGNYVDPGDISTWPSGCDASCQAEWILFAEDLIEKITGTWFYSKAFDLEINGNNKNRIFLPVHANILTVTSVYICDTLLDPSMYDWDTSSVYLNLCGSGAFQSGAELEYIMSQYEDNGIFPHGDNNLRFIGTYGYSTVPQTIKKVVEWLVDAINDGSFDTGAVGAYKSEKIGDYSYTKGLTGYAKDGVYTGIGKVDALLRHYMKQKKTIVMAP